MEWTRSETIALAKHSCTLCHGIGLRPSWGESFSPCNCVLRAIFRACYVRFRHCADKQQCLTVSNYEYLPDAGTVAVMYDHKNEEYAADFISIAKRTLDESEYRLFKFHFLLGAEWKLCAARLQIDRGSFFHTVYRIQQKLGRAFRETKPYGIFPIYAYYEDQRQPATALEIAEETLAGMPERSAPRIQPKKTVHPYPGEEREIRRRRIA